MTQVGPLPQGCRKLQAWAGIRQRLLRSKIKTDPLPHVARPLLRTAGPVSFKPSVSKTASATPKRRGVKVVWKCCNSIDTAPPDTLCRIRPNTGPNNALKVKLIKLTTPVAVPPNCGGLASLITV